MHSATHQAIDAVWRLECGRIVAGVARMVRDVGLAEELAQDALVSALEHWPTQGVPDKPGAWLMATAKNKALDRLRREKMLAGKLEQIGHDLEAQQAHVVPDFVDALDAARQDDIGDDLLRLIFTACHPLLSSDARVALTLKLLGGLTTHEIARQDWMRPALCDEAIRLGRMLAEVAPGQSEAHGLLALMELQASRSAARVDAPGKPVLLLEQDRRRWDRLLIRRGLAALQRAEAAGGEREPYALQAAIAACHARAVAASETDWQRIAGRYEVLAQIAPSPVVELNRAVAVGMARGPAQGLAIVDALRHEPTLVGYQWLPGVRADLLAKLGRKQEAQIEFEKAAALAGNARERELLLTRAKEMGEA